MQTMKDMQMLQHLRVRFDELSAPIQTLQDMQMLQHLRVRFNKLWPKVVETMICKLRTNCVQQLVQSH